MPHYMFRFQFKDSAVKGMVENPQDREGPARALLQSFGGRLVSYYFTAGEYDGFAIAELPDLGSAAALSLKVAATGTMARFETVPLLTTAEAQAAMQRAKTTAMDYRPPGT
jgi:uncharacterized protein with GYD domain